MRHNPEEGLRLGWASLLEERQGQRGAYRAAGEPALHGIFVLPWCSWSRSFTQLHATVASRHPARLMPYRRPMQVDAVKEFLQGLKFSEADMKKVGS